MTRHSCTTRYIACDYSTCVTVIAGGPGENLAPLHQRAWTLGWFISPAGDDDRCPTHHPNPPPRKGTNP